MLTAKLLPTKKPDVVTTSGLIRAVVYRLAIKQQEQLQLQELQQEQLQ